MIFVMEGMTNFLVGIRPPSNIERSLFEIKESLFRRFAVVSAVALGPILPLVYTDVAPPEPDAVTLPRGIVLSSRAWAIEKETLFLDAHPGSGIEALRQHVAQVREPKDHGRTSAAIKLPVPVYPGFFLCSIRELSSSRHWNGLQLEGSATPVRKREVTPLKEILSFLNSPPQFRWTGSILCCWRFRYVEYDYWWDAVEYEEVWSTRLRKREGKTSKRSDPRR